MKKILIKVLFFCFLVGCNTSETNEVELLINKEEKSLVAFNSRSYHKVGYTYLDNELIGLEYDNVIIDHFEELVLKSNKLGHIQINNSLIDSLTSKVNSDFGYLSFDNCTINFVDWNALSFKVLRVKKSSFGLNKISIQSPSVTDIELIDCKLEGIEFNSTNNVKNLNIAYNKKYNNIEGNLYSLEGIEKLNIAGTGIRELQIDSFPKLKHLVVDSNFFNINQTYLNSQSFIELDVVNEYPFKW